MRYMRSRKRYLVFLLFTIICVFLTLNRHSRSGRFNYHAEIWADKAGYYIYSPALFNYQFRADKLPDSLDVKTGGGFKIEKETNKIITKYTYGVALMQLPFYVVAEAYSLITIGESEPFSIAHHKAIDFAAVFYLVVGFWFLAKFLRFYVDEVYAYLALFVLFIGSNLYYYSICDTGMSHIYSFSLCSYFLYLIKSNNFQFHHSKTLLKLGFIIGMIVLIRPVNLVFISALLFLDCSSQVDIKERFISLVNIRNIIFIGLTFLTVFIPQLIYWKFTSGSFITYSYNKEGFNWLSPQLLQIWFAPNNGLFLYNPFYFLMLFSGIYLIIKKNYQYVFMPVLFFVISYVYSCWWDWAFGCSFGNRNFVEYTSILILPFAVLIQRFTYRARLVLLLIAILLTVPSLLAVYRFDGCYFGQGNYDWSFYLNLINI